MHLSFENYRTRWLVLVAVWAASASVLLFQAGVTRSYLDLGGRLGLRGAAEPTTPLKETYPVFAADAQTWVRHALSLHEGSSLQLRHTTIDNAPYGREVHWNSAWAWAIVGAGWINHLFSGTPITQAIERATVWLTPITLIGLIVLLSGWTTQRAGLIPGVFLVVAMTCHDRIIEGFFPAYVDHHGLMTVAVLGNVLGAVLMGAGWWKQSTEGVPSLLPRSPEVVRTAAVFSAFCAACGVWVSAASVIPSIAIVGLAGLGTVVVQGRYAREQGATFDPEAWRLWGRVGAGFCMFFYLIEYFPRHLGLRLEVNHPLHAFAWLGGGELIAQLGERWLRPAHQRWSHLRPLIWPVCAIASVPLTVALGGAKVLAFLDPFMSRLHNDYIQEFLPLWKTLRTFDTKTAFQIAVVDSSPLLAAIASLTYWRRESPIVLWFATFVAGALTSMAWMQSRWQLNASGGQVCLALVVLACWTSRYRPLVRWLAVAALVGVLYLPNAVFRATTARRELKAKIVSSKDASLALARDVASVLRATQPQGEIVMLSSPNASTSIGYYGRFKTLGTLYWENTAGLKAAAAIYSAPTDEEAARLIKLHKVTHIAILSEENFIQQYCELLVPGATPERIKQSFGYRVYIDKVVPQWLQMIPYKVPDDLKSLNISAMLFKVNFNQSTAEALYHIALAQISQDAIEDADRNLNLLITQTPQLHQPWLRRAELLIARRDWEKATEHYLQGIARSPAAERPMLYENAAGILYNARQHALAVRLYRAAMADQRVPNLLCYLSWVLSTSTEDSLRDGEEALALAQEALATDPNAPVYLNALAAALAELGRFPEAIAAGDRAVANAKLRGDHNVAQIFEQRLQVLRSGKPMRF